MSTLMENRMGSAFGSGGMSVAGVGASGAAGLLGGMGAMMGPIGLALMGFGAAFNAINVMKQAKQQKRDMEDEASEIRRLAGVEQQTNLDMQIMGRKEGDIAGGHVIASGTGKGLVADGSTSLSHYRKAVIQNIEDVINFRSRQSVEKQTTMNLRANRIDRQARRLVKDAKWKAFSSILGGAADVGMGGYNMGLWGGKEDV